MEFNQQVFKAPSIPKISKRTISSPVIRGAIRPRLKFNRSAFSFRPRTAIQEVAQKISSPIGEQQTFVDQSSIANTLVETNKILVQIQKQLEQDFNYRIDKEKEEVKKIRSGREKQKYSKEEESLESIKKVGDILTKPLTAITKPVKGIFDKIKEFFSILIEGIIVKNVFTWLSKKENRDKVAKVFEFLTDHWKWFAGIVVGGIALKALYKIIRLVKAVRSVLRFLRILPKKGGASGDGERSVSRGGLLRTGEGARRGITTEKTGRLRQTYDRYDPNSRPGSGMQEIYKRTKSPVGKALQGIDVGFKKVGSNIMKSIGMGPGAKGIFKFLRPIFKRIPFIGGLIDFAVSLALGEPLGRAAAKSVGAMLGGALGSFPPLIPFGGPIWGSIAGDLIAGGVYDALTKGKTAEEGEKAEDVPKMELGGKLKGPSHSAGGIKLEAEGGEYLVRKRMVPRYEPVLRDINENGARMWEEFVAGVKLQKTINDESYSNSKELEKLLQKYNELLKEEEQLLQEKQSKLTSNKGGPNNPNVTVPTKKVDSQKITFNNSNSQQRMKETKPIINNTNINNTFGSPNIIKPNVENNLISNMITPVIEKIKVENSNKMMSLIPLPPIVMNSGGNVPNIQLPNYNSGEQEIPNILSVDISNEYLNISLVEYGIVGIEA